MSARTTVPSVRTRKVRRGDVPLVMVTAYDAPGARMADEAGVDMILVGDSLAMVVLGYEDTLQVTVDDMAHHTAAVARAGTSAMVVADLPWLSYHVSTEDTVRNAARLVRAGAQAVKLEGGRKRLPMVDALVDAEIPVMGHIGLTPQSVNAMGGFKVQGRQHDAALALVDDAEALAAAGCFAIVCEGMPDEVARMVTDAVDVPTIGIGAGVHCDGQVLVFHDVLGIEDRITPKFVRRYASLKADGVAGLSAFAADVRGGQFPSAEESYHLGAGTAEALGLGAALALAGCSSSGGTASPGGAAALGTTVLPSGAVAPTGFRSVTVVVTRPDGTVERHCMWLADDPVLQDRGLMEVTDAALGGRDGMVFVFGADTSASFWMRDTRLPLSIAFVDSSGAVVSTADMAPCPDSVSDCPTYPAARPFRLAVEVPEGALAGLGVVEGSTVALGDACDA